MKTHLKEVAPSIWHYKSPEPGKKRIISGGIHGNEKAGIFVVEKLAEEIRAQVLQPGGELFLLLGNLDAIAFNERYIKHDMGRLFGNENRKIGPEQDRADKIKATIKEHMPKVDEHFDIHNVIKPADPFIVWPQEIWPEDPNLLHPVFDILHQLKFKTLLYGKGFYGVGGDHTCFDTYTHKVHGANAITIEAGSSNDTSLAKKLFCSMKNILMGGEISPGQNRHKIGVWYGSRSVIKQTQEFQFNFTIENFDPLPNGMFAHDEGIQFHATRGEYIVFPNSNVLPGLRAGVIVNPHPSPNFRLGCYI